MTRPVPPRLYAQVATRAPVAAVFGRGPSTWSFVARWDLATGALEVGAWLRGTLYPRRCDVSPDGKLLSYFALKQGARPFLGGTFTALAKLPWLTALAAWREDGTWTRGHHFVDRRGARAATLGRPDAGSAEPLRARYGLACTGVEQYAAERRRGWVDHEHCPPRAPGDTWDERRRVILARPRPRGAGRLILTDQGWDARAAHRVEGRAPSYRFEDGRRRIDLDDVMWADFDPGGRLLVATRTGRLQVRAIHRDALAIVAEHDLSALRPDPRRAPTWARTWSEV